jgi:hypothetical protein
MARTRARVIAEQEKASTTSTYVSSVPFLNSNAGSTVDTPATSGEEEEKFNFQKRLDENVKRTRGTCQKRSAESDGDDQSISIKPPAKRRAAMKAAVYVEIPVWSANVSVGITLAPTVFN